MPPALWHWLYQGNRRKSLDFLANVRAFLGRFVKGKDTIDNQDYMKSWSDDVWELRVQNQRKGERVRIFGAFAKSDVFVAFFQKPRDYFWDMSDPKWKEATDRVVSEWDAYFPRRPRMKARPSSNCVSFNYFDVHKVS
jgi:hypothetical protein